MDHMHRKDREPQLYSSVHVKLCRRQLMIITGLSNVLMLHVAPSEQSCKYAGQG